jgi:hypothetical protein
MSKNNKNEVLGLLPCGLGWSTAMRRGVGLPPLPKNDVSHNSAEFLFLSRTRDRYLTKQQESKAFKKIGSSAQIARAIPFTSTSTKIYDLPSNNDHSSLATAVKMGVVALQPRDRKVGPQVEEMSLSATNEKDYFALQQSKPSTVISGAINVASKRAVRDNSIYEANNGEPGELKQQLRLVSSNVQTVPISKFDYAQGKQNQRNELKNAKNEHINR